MKLSEFLRLLPLLLLLLVCSLIATGLFNHAPATSNMIGKHLPHFHVPLINDANSSLTANSWKGQVAVINIFASWCKPCQAEHETLMALAQSGKVNVYGIAWRDKPANVIAFLGAHGNPYQLIGNDETGGTTSAFAITGVPETVVVDRDGIIRYHHRSPIDDEEINTVILPLVEKLNSLPAKTQQEAPVIHAVRPTKKLQNAPATFAPDSAGVAAARPAIVPGGVLVPTDMPPLVGNTNPEPLPLPDTTQAPLPSQDDESPSPTAPDDAPGH